MVPAEGDNDTSETTAAIAEAARPAPAVGPLAEDVACIGCGYNLRGLASTGRCPECGRPAQGSVALHRARRKAPPPPDPRWARQVAEGAGLSLLAFVLFAVLCLAPQQWFYLPYRYAPARDTPGRTTLLCVAAAAWVLAWYAAWKLTARPPAGEAPRLRRRARVARWALTAYAVVPFFAPAFGESMSGPAAVSILALVLAGVVGVAALTACVADLFRRTGMRRTGFESATLAVINPAAAVMAFLLPAGHGGISSLDLMLDLPMHPFGTPAMLRVALRLLVDGNDMMVVLVPFVLVAIWNVLLMARLEARYRPLARRPAQDPAATAPSVE
jgi:hypothetical protein